MHLSSPPPIEPSASAPPATTASLVLPRTFGPYTLFELIGKGGMAEIYLARAETGLGATRLAVVKQILPSFADDSRFEAMLTHEAKLAARLSHARVVQVFDLGRADGHLFIAMEYVEGFDLNALLRQCTDRQVGLPVEHALGIVADVLEGLDYAHRLKGEDGRPLGLVHRDVSPSNILISYEGEVKLCDFGIAHANDLVREGANEALKGKAGYMSPEHASGEPLDARADVFAAGIVLWELLSGHRLYRPKGDLPLLEQARRAEIPPLPDKGLPNADVLEGIVQRALARAREARYPSALAMLRDLEAYLAQSGLLASRLKLGEWMAGSFGTALVEQRRASERRLPKSSPPPRSSDRLPVLAKPSSRPATAAAPSSERARSAVPAAPPALSPDDTPSDVPPVRAGLLALAPPLTSGRVAEEGPVAGPRGHEPRGEEALEGEALEAAAESEPPPSSVEAMSATPSPALRPVRPMPLIPVSSGAMRAFKRELEEARAELLEGTATGLPSSPPVIAAEGTSSELAPTRSSRVKPLFLVALVVAAAAFFAIGRLLAP